jgi:hypothetical protein
VKRAIERGHIALAGNRRDAAATNDRAAHCVAFAARRPDDLAQIARPGDPVLRELLHGANDERTGCYFASNRHVAPEQSAQSALQFVTRDAQRRRVAEHDNRCDGLPVVLEERCIGNERIPQPEFVPVLGRGSARREQAREQNATDAPLTHRRARQWRSGDCRLGACHALFRTWVRDLIRQPAGVLTYTSS